jgi:adenine-specific DNA-methyltransferase
MAARNYYGKGRYPVVTPSGRKLPGPPPGTHWRVEKTRFKAFDADGRIWWGPDGNGIPRIKRYLSEVKQGRVPQTLWFYDEVGHTQDTKKELLQIMGFSRKEDVFVTPKPLGLIRRIIDLATQPDSIVLDSFAGSGTTAHAVLSANAEDGGNRRFILVASFSLSSRIT